MSNSQKTSQFSKLTSLNDASDITLIDNGQNFTISYADFKTGLGVTGTLTSVGDPLGEPVLNNPSPNEYEIRTIESGAGVIASASPENGITLNWNVDQDSEGVPLTSGLTNVKPVISSLAAGPGISIVKVGDEITLTNTTDPSTGLSNRIVVTEAADLSGALDSTKQYFLDGIIDMGSQSIEIPAGGLTITGYSFDLSKLISSAVGYTMFVSPGGGSGNVIGKDYAIEVTGSGSQVYNLVSNTGFEAFEFTRINYNDCESLGSIDNYRQGLENGTGRFGGKPQLTLVGTWLGGYFIDTSIVRNLDDGAYSLFSAGTAFSMTSRFRSNQNIDLPANVSFIDFASSNFVNPSTLQLDGCIVTRGGVFDATDTNLIPNVAASDLVSEWTDNNGIDNTFVGGEDSISAEIATVITSDGVYVDLAGTYNPMALTHFDSPASGQLRHLGGSPREYQVVGQFVIVGSANNTIAMKAVIFRSATTSFEDGRIQRRVINSLQGGRDVAYFGYFDNITLNKNDYVKFQVANIGATNNVTAELDSLFVVQAR